MSCLVSLPFPFSPSPPPLSLLLPLHLSPPFPTPSPPLRPLLLPLLLTRTHMLSLHILTLSGFLVSVDSGKKGSSMTVEQ